MPDLIWSIDMMQEVGPSLQIAVFAPPSARAACYAADIAVPQAWCINMYIEQATTGIYQALDDMFVMLHCWLLAAVCCAI